MDLLANSLQQYTDNNGLHRIPIEATMEKKEREDINKSNLANLSKIMREFAYPLSNCKLDIRYTLMTESFGKHVTQYKRNIDAGIF